MKLFCSQKLVLLIWSLFFLSGCVSIDPRTSSEKVNTGATSTLQGVFENKSDYQSKTLDIFSSKITLAELLGFHDAMSATDVEILFEEKKTLHIRFLADGKVVKSKEYVAGADFKMASDGKISIEQKHGCGLDPNSGIGCEGRSTTLFVNAAGDLVCNVSRGGAGLAFLVIPIGGYTDEMTIHRKLTH